MKLEGGEGVVVVDLLELYSAESICVFGIFFGGSWIYKYISTKFSLFICNKHFYPCFRVTRITSFQSLFTQDLASYSIRQQQDQYISWIVKSITAYRFICILVKLHLHLQKNTNQFPY